MTPPPASAAPESPRHIDLPMLRQMRAKSQPIAMLTCYDYSTARVLRDTGLHILLVGDTSAMMMLGEDSTIPVTMDFLVTITAAVRRGAPNLFIMADLPFASYPDGPTAVANAARFMKEAGAHAVKLECDARHIEIIATMAAAGIPTCAHLGLLPQRAAQQGGYKAQGRTFHEAERIISDAVALAQAGAELLLLEAVPDEVAAGIVERTNVPVLGCGAGPSCHGHVVVLHDLLGFNARHPRFVDVLAEVPAEIKKGASAFVESVQNRQYPAARHRYQMKPEIKEVRVVEPK